MNGIRTTGRTLLSVGVAGAALTAAVTAAGAVQPGKPSTATAGCTAADVDVALGTVVYESRIKYAPVHVTAKSGVTCSLRGYPTGFQFHDATGEPLPTGEDPPGNDGATVAVTAGSPAHFRVTWEAYPDGPPPVPQVALSFTLPGAGSASTIDWTGGDVYRSGYLSQSAVQPGLGDA